jgi:diacylglycerol kinase (CTP)
MSHIPSTPRVISPSPTPSDISSRESYFAPVTRSATRRSQVSTPAAVPENATGSPGLQSERRSRTRSRSPVLHTKIAPLTKSNAATARKPAKRKVDGSKETNGHLAPPKNQSYWRGLSRSPSPLGLIPVHLEFRKFVWELRFLRLPQRANMSTDSST